MNIDRVSAKDRMNPAAIEAYIIRKLDANPNGLTETELSEKHDALLVNRVLDMMFTNAKVKVIIDDKQIGGRRKIYRRTTKNG